MARDPALRVLVTGHDGYLGSDVVAVLLAAGHHVTGLDAGWFTHRAISPLPQPDRAVRRDIRDMTEGDLQDIDVVVHLAGLSNDPLGDRDPVVTDAINHLATARLGRLAAAAGVRQFVFASTCSVYGGAGENVVDERSAIKPLTAYARSKADAEQGLGHIDGLDVISLRLATAFGPAPRLRADLVVNNLVAWARTTGQVLLLSDGRAWRPLVHVQDIARVVAAVVARTNLPPVLDVVGPDGNQRIVDVARIVGEQLGLPVVTADGVGTDHRSYRVAGDLLRRHLGPTARVSLAAGVHGLDQAYRVGGFTTEDLERTLRRTAWLDHLEATGALTTDLRWT